MDTPFHVRLKKLRKTRNWTQQHLAKLVKRTRAHIASLETGRRQPGPSDLAELARVFGITVAGLGAVAARPPKPRRTHRRKIYRLFRATLPTPVSPSGPRTWVRLLHARRAYSLARDLMVKIRMRKDRSEVNRFIQSSASGSREEGMLLLHALAGGARPDSFSVMRLGYRELPVTDEGQRMLGDRPVPALWLEGKCPVLLFPQVTVRLLDPPPDYPYRSATLDFLALVRVERTKVWINVDVNGEGHDGREDVRRTKLIGLPRLAVTPEHLQRRDFLEWFVKELSRMALGTLEAAA